MNQREKLLAAIVGVVVLILALWWGGNRLTTAFSARNDKIASLEKEVSDKQRTVQRGKLAEGKLKNWEKNSLPSDTNLAQTQYRVWLHDLSQKTGLKAEVKPSSPKAYGQLYVQNSFRITGHAELPKLVDFLHKFYGTGYLHRISSLNLKRLPDKKEIEVNIAIDAMSLNQAPHDKEDPPPPSEKGPTNAPEHYVQAIASRNLLSDENSPPKIESSASQRAHPNQSFSFTVKATDPDKLDKLTYALEGPAPEGAKIDPKTGEFRWTPKTLGDDYEATVLVTDDGFPPKSVTQKIKIAVVEPPPAVKENPFARDDPARDAKVTAMVGSANQLQVWVTVPRGLGDQPKTLHLNSGDPISVGSFVGVVKAIREREAEFELKDGRTVVVRLDQSLVSDERRL